MLIMVNGSGGAGWCATESLRKVFPPNLNRTKKIKNDVKKPEAIYSQPSHLLKDLKYLRSSAEEIPRVFPSMRYRAQKFTTNIALTAKLPDIDSLRKSLQMRKLLKLIF